jgi:Yip1 domain
MNEEQSSYPPLEPQTKTGGSAFSRVIRIFSQPTAVFRELAVTPTFLVPLVVILLFAIGAQAVITSRLDMEAAVRERLAASSSSHQMTDEEMDRAVGIANKMSKVFLYATPVTVPIFFILVSGIYFLGLKVLGSESEFKPVFATVVHSSLPASIVGGALTMLVAWKHASIAPDQVERMVKSSLAAWLPASAPKMLVALAGVLDIFNLWQWILLALGFQIVAKVSRNKAIGLVAVVWGVWALGKVGLAALR